MRKDLIEFGSEQIQSSHDTTIRSQIVLFHYFLIVDRVPDIDVCVEWEMHDGWIEVEDVRRSRLRMEVRIDALH